MRIFTLIKGNKLAVPLVLLIATATLTINETAYWHTSKYMQQSMTITRTRAILIGLHVHMLNADTGARGYVLTGRAEYLEPYKNAVALTRQDFVELNQLYVNHAESLAMIKEVELLSISKISRMAQAIDLSKNGLPQANLDIYLDEKDRRLMQRVHLIINTLLATEAANLSVSQKNMQLTILTSRMGIGLISIICLLAMLIYIRKNYQLRINHMQLRSQFAVERDQFELIVLKRTEELTLLARYLQTNREDERSRLARNLHDDLGALLTSAKMDAARIKSRAVQLTPDTLELLEHLVGNLNSSIALGRKIIEDLRPSALNNLGLVATLEILAREFAHSSGLQIHSSFEEVDLPPDSQLMVYRLMQEACTNIIKYSKAESVWLKLGEIDGVIVASVRDDGVGFDTDAMLSTSYGLLGMRYRVEASQGVLNIISSPNNGTLIQALL